MRLTLGGLTTMRNSEEDRARMVEVQLARRGIDDPRVIAAFRKVPREAFVPDSLVEFAYDDRPLAIGYEQTISQPYIVAIMAQALGLRAHQRILDVGTGSGYAAAILSCLAKEVWSVERIPSLAESAKARLLRLGFDNVRIRCGDGCLGWSEHAPYDAIAVAAGGVTAPPALLAQLAIHGRLVIPVGPQRSEQVLMCITRDGETSYRHASLGRVRFVPLIPDPPRPS